MLRIDARTTLICLMEVKKVIKSLKDGSQEDFLPNISQNIQQWPHLYKSQPDILDAQITNLSTLMMSFSDGGFRLNGKLFTFNYCFTSIKI